MKTAIITGVNGQTGSVLSKLLLEKGYEVHGMIRRASKYNLDNLKESLSHPNFNFFYGDLTDSSSIYTKVRELQPDCFFNLAANSFVKASFDIPEYTMDVNSTGVVRCLEAIRTLSPKTRFLQASTSELYGSTPPPQNENSCMTNVMSPYAAAKLGGFAITKNYREMGLFSCNSISFNHSGISRSNHFFEKKLIMAACRIKKGLEKELVVGNLNSYRDFLDARDVANAQIMILEADKADDFVVGSGKSISMQALTEVVFKKIDLNWEQYVRIDSKYFRPTEVDHLRSDPSKIKQTLGWEPKISFNQMIDEMIEHEMKLLEKNV